MHISAKVDYAVRALIVLAGTGDQPMTAPSLAESAGLPQTFLDAILAELRRSGIVASQRGADGGYRLARSAETVTIANVFRAIDGPLAEVRGERPENSTYAGSAKHLQEVWIAVRASLRGVLERTTLADVASGRLPTNVKRLAANPDAWTSH